MERSFVATALAVAVATALTGCGKAQEKAAEKAIESSLSTDGTKAKVDMSDRGMKVSTTDASGKTSQLEFGGTAQVSEADAGVAFYPGAKPIEGSAMRMVSGDSTALRVGLQSGDAPDKVTTFYRDKLKTMSEGKQLIDMASPDGAMLGLIDDKAKSSITVQIGKGESAGSSIMISSTRGKP
jgi:hypothetical protein